jgi:hypothetical protein
MYFIVFFILKNLFCFLIVIVVYWWTTCCVSAMIVYSYNFFLDDSYRFMCLLWFLSFFQYYIMKVSRIM